MLTVKLFENQAISGTTVYTSDAVDLGLISGYSLQISTTSTATGVLKAQVSNDGSVWTDVPNSGNTAHTSVSGAGNYYKNVANDYYRYVRVVYTNATNSGTLSVVLYGKKLAFR